jgi:tripartite-type tricarboxylate transporter receptor subunit TctC
MRRLMCQANVLATVITASLVFSTSPSWAQPWPQHAVRMIVPVGPGSSPDVAARVFAERLETRWGKPIAVENRPGADGLIGTAAFANAHDDHLLLFSFAAPLSLYPVIEEKLAYDPVHDVLPVSIAVETFGTIAVPASLPITTLPELVSFSRGRPGRLNWATGGGAFPVLMAGFNKARGLQMTHVPYRDQNLAVQDTAEGRIQVFATAMTAVLPFVQSGKLRVLAVTNKRRSPLWPDVPTVMEAGYPDLAFEGLIGVFASRGTPDARRTQISSDMTAVAADQAVAKSLGSTGQIVRGSTPAEFAAAIEDQRLRMAEIVRQVGTPPR